VTGTLHRLPRTVRVPLRLAARLAAAGAPLDVESGREKGALGFTTIPDSVGWGRQVSTKPR
jgi:hypothetical protein